MNVYQFVCVCVCFCPFGFEGGMWDLIALVPDHCISLYFKYITLGQRPKCRVFNGCPLLRNLRQFYRQEW